MKLIVANLKLYLDGTTLKMYLQEAKNFNKNIIICPTSIHIPYFLNNTYKVGIQNIAPQNIPSQTGEVSSLQAKNLGVSYAIIGHSERRKKFNENDELINQKVKEALTNNLKPILCVGETLEEYQNSQTLNVVKTQLEKGLKDIKEEIIIAYEPVFAIGTGKVPNNNSIEEVTNFIKNETQKITNKAPKVLYGGSVNNENILTLEQLKTIDGYLIGSASAKIEVFKDLISKIMRQKTTK